MSGRCHSGNIELFGLTVHDQLTERQASTRPLGREGALAPRSWAIARATSASPARKLSLQCLDLLAEPGHAGPIRSHRRFGAPDGDIHVPPPGGGPAQRRQHEREPFGPSRHRPARSGEHTSELQSRGHLVCRLLLEKKKEKTTRRLDMY